MTTLTFERRPAITLPPGKVTYRPREIAAATGLSRAKVFQLIASGRLLAFKIDGCRLVPREELERLLNG